MVVGQTKSNVTTKNMITISYCQQELQRCDGGQENNPIVIYRHRWELAKQPIHYLPLFTSNTSVVIISQSTAGQR